MPASWQDTEGASDYSTTEVSATPSESTTPGASAANTPRSGSALTPEPVPFGTAAEAAGPGDTSTMASRRAVHDSHQESSMTSAAAPVPAPEKGKKKRGKNRAKAADAMAAPFKALSRAISGGLA